jgi:hypothetical protein
VGIKKETHGHKGWVEVKAFEGKTRDGQMVGDQVFRNIETGQIARHERGWSGEPPGPTGDMACVRHSSPAFRRNYDAIKWNTVPQSQS